MNNVQQLINANKNRLYFAQYNENPKAYPESAQSEGLLAFQTKLNSNYNFLINDTSSDFYGEEVSPYMLTGLGIHYPKLNANDLIEKSSVAFNQWRNIEIDTKYTILTQSLENVSKRFFELAYSTMHTTGQSFLMSFQASGPHACDRALEVLAAGYEQLNYYPKQIDWTKNLGKFDLTIHKNYKPIPKGISLVIGCSTFPTWNTVPGLYASLITGNTVIVKPHPKSVYPIAIFIEELRKVLAEHNINPDVVSMAIDSIENPITRILAEHSSVKLIDYTGGSKFGSYIESLGKVCFTEKAGINSILIDSVNDADKIFQNIAFSISLYSGQMCTAPQNIYISKDGIQTSNGHLSFDECVTGIHNALSNLLGNPKAAAPTLGAIQNQFTIDRINNKMNEMNNNSKLIEVDLEVVNDEFKDARIALPKLLVINADSTQASMEECFGPLSFIIKTNSYEDSLSLMKSSGEEHGAITCLAYTTNDAKMKEIEDQMNSVFVPVSFNFTGAAFVNQHAAFSDLHVSGGNPSGNATFTNADFINKRYIWIGNRYLL
jgi:phenylacetic acid degradation protein paaN